MASTVKNAEKTFGSSTIIDDAQDNVRNLGRKAKDYMNAAYDSVSHTKENVTSEIRRNPVQSSLVALGIGFLLGALVRR